MWGPAAFPLHTFRWPVDGLFYCFFRLLLAYCLLCFFILLSFCFAGLAWLHIGCCLSFYSLAFWLFFVVV
jgi:hypothetical protein